MTDWKNLFCRVFITILALLLTTKKGSSSPQRILLLTIIIVLSNMMPLTQSASEGSAIHRCWDMDIEQVTITLERGKCPGAAAYLLALSFSRYKVDWFTVVKG